jgi:predicted amidohydrolase
VAGSFLQRTKAGVVNVAHIFGPTGVKGRYEKLMPTPWERDVAKVKGGHEIGVFDTGKARIGLVICYDIEFPLIGRALAEAGAEVIVAPSNTETEWGYWRVRTGAMARALENQIYTVHCPTVGEAPGVVACPINIGAAGIFAPSDRGFPPGGVIALGEMNRPQWVYATLDLDLIATVRQSGGVQTYRHWTEQPGAGPLPQARLIDISGQHTMSRGASDAVAATPA